MNIRRFFRTGVLVGALALVAYRMADMAHSYHEWSESVCLGDRSAADLYRLNLEVDCVEIAVILGLAAFGVFLLRPKSESR